MNNKDLVCELPEKITSRITSLSCQVYKQCGMNQENVCQEKIRNLLLKEEIEFIIPCEAFVRENIPGSSFACFLLNDKNFLLIFRRQTLTRFSLEKLRLNLKATQIKTIMVIVFREWGVTIRKSQIHSQSG